MRNKFLNEKIEVTPEVSQRILEKLRRQKASLKSVKNSSKIGEIAAFKSVKQAKKTFFPLRSQEFLNTYHLSKKAYQEIKDLKIFIPLLFREDSEEYEKVSLIVSQQEHCQKGLWKKSFISKKNWVWLQSEDFTDLIKTCEMCKRKMRYGHLMSNSQYSKNLWVGSICAGYMMNDMKKPFSNEKTLSERALNRACFADKRWSVSQKENPYFRPLSEGLIVILTAHDGQYKYSINGKYSNKTFKRPKEAKQASLEEVFPKTFQPSE